MTSHVESVGHQVFKDSPIVRVPPRDDGPACLVLIAEALFGSHRQDLPNLAFPNAAACFEKAGIEEQTVAWTDMDSRVASGFHDRSRISFAGCQRFFHVHMSAVSGGDC